MPTIWERYGEILNACPTERKDSFTEGLRGLALVIASETAGLILSLERNRGKALVIHTNGSLGSSNNLCLVGRIPRKGKLLTAKEYPHNGFPSSDVCADGDVFVVRDNILRRNYAIDEHDILGRYRGRFPVGPVHICGGIHFSLLYTPPNAIIAADFPTVKEYEVMDSKRLNLTAIQKAGKRGRYYT